MVRGPARSLKAIHGGQATHEKSAAPKIAGLLRGGLRPQASVAPAERRATRALLRRRRSRMRRRAALLTHVQPPKSHSNVPALGKNIAAQANREGVAARCPDPVAPNSRAVDLALLAYADRLLTALALTLVHTAKAPQAQVVSRLRSIPGVGPLRALVLLDAIHDIQRLPRGQAAVSSCRLVRCAQEAAGNR